MANVKSGRLLGIGHKGGLASGRRNYKLGLGIGGLTHKQLSENGKKGGHIGGRITIWKALAVAPFSPTNLEQRVFGLAQYHNLPLDFVGDSRSRAIGGKFPDFIDENTKSIVEVANKNEKEFRLKRPWKDYERRRISHFGKCGYRCLVLWEDMTDEQMVSLMIRFLGIRHNDNFINAAEEG